MGDNAFMRMEAEEEVSRLRQQVERLQEDRARHTKLLIEKADGIERLRAALVEIRDHWANQYDHPRKESPMYAGPYGIGVTDGHRAAAIIASKALGNEQVTRKAT